MISTEHFTALRSHIDQMAGAALPPKCRCADCGQAIELIHGKRSSKWFWMHIGLGGCEGVRPIFFGTKQEATESEEVFQ